MVKETNRNEKNTKKKILPFVMSTSMLTAAIFGAGGSALAAENGEKEFKNHGEKVSYYATSIPGSPEKGKFMRTIANKNFVAAEPDEEDSNDTTGDDDTTDAPNKEEEAVDAPAEEEADVDAPAEEEADVDAPAEEEADVDAPAEEECSG
ncbi:hypothetical protein [Sporosarcina highlanderae]|uniref:Uncharacterized protein n=1 Tax=Sporosarcina highlanderae TaxID=3035916 RepID=A0ABT8JTJ0_9BACL|nr:hypothetical protein [Sporosarcina highlanderae]MDN4608430.1 hypothetical protein [Sporosarcina highlanderae]